MKLNNTLDKDDIFNVKNKIIELYNKSDIIHVYVKRKHKREIYAVSRITGIYDRFFNVESKVGYYDESFTIEYISLLTGSVKISELEI